jgi:site-specific recombinase XerD
MTPPPGRTPGLFASDRRTPDDDALVRKHLAARAKTASLWRLADEERSIRDWRVFLACRGHGLLDADASDVWAAVHSWRATYAASTARERRRALRQLYRSLASRGLIAANPWMAVPLPPKEGR